MIRVLGIDPGLANTGWGILDAEGSRLLHIAHGTVTSEAGMEEQYRLLKIFNAIRKLIETYEPALVGVETLYFSKNRRSAIPVAQARGVVLVAAAQAEVETASHNPQDIKQALTGNGRAEKHQVQDMVRLLLGLEEIPRPDHAADALAAAICSYHLRQFHSQGREDVSQS
mgnify:CR=1 FL=1